MNEKEKKVVECALNWYMSGGLSGRYELWCAIADLYKSDAVEHRVQLTDETCENCGRPLNGGACAPCFAPSLEDFVSN